MWEGRRKSVRMKVVTCAYDLTYSSGSETPFTRHGMFVSPKRPTREGRFVTTP